MEKICNASCPQYVVLRRCCSYTDSFELVKPGERCLHPEFDEKEFFKQPLSNFLDKLVSGE